MGSKEKIMFENVKKGRIENILSAVIGFFRPEITSLADKVVDQIPENSRLRSKAVDRLVGVSSQLIREKGKDLGTIGSALSKLFASFLERTRLYKKDPTHKPTERGET